MYNTVDIGVYTEMDSSRTDLNCTIFPESVDHFDRMPDSLILLVFNKIADAKALGRCGVVSRRFKSLVPQVENVVIGVVDGVISADNAFSLSAAVNYKTYNSFFTLFSLVLFCLIESFESFTLFFADHSPIQVLKNFNEIKSLRIELPGGEVGIDEEVLLRWRADFGSTLDYFVILAASSSVTRPVTKIFSEWFDVCVGSKLRALWTISPLIAASAKAIISEHKALDSLILSDGDGQGVLCMNREQLEELRVKPFWYSAASKTALSMRLWYAPRLELPDGTVLKGATLVAIRPSEVPREDENWVASAFEEPYGTAARMLVKRRTCVEMNSF